MVEIIIAAFLLAIGVTMLYFLDRNITNPQSLLFIIIGIIFLLSGGWLVASIAGVAFFILKKVIGFVLLAAGGFLLWKYPSIIDYQGAGFSGLGIFIGFILFFVGFYLFFLDWAL